MYLLLTPPLLQKSLEDLGIQYHMPVQRAVVYNGGKVSHLEPQEGSQHRHRHQRTTDGASSGSENSLVSDEFVIFSSQQAK